MTTMYRHVRCCLLLLLPFALSGCGASSDSSASGSKTTAAPASVSKYDQGPRAGESPADEALAKTGEQLFKDKGCSACHAFGTRLSGPDLSGVSMRRTAQWMENQILHPEVMVKEDPISRELMGTYALQMPNQGLAAPEAKAIIEYLKHQDHEASEADEKEED
jgi:mono/diheme cytochrome c family protein